MSYTYEVNTTSSLNPSIVLPMVQANLEKKMCLKHIANTQMERYLTSGDELVFNTMSRLHVKDYAPGTPVASQGVVFAEDKLLINQTKMVNFNTNKVQVRQSAVKNMEAELSMEAGYQLANNIDQFGLEVAVNGASESINTTASALSNSTTLPTFTSAIAALKYNRAGNGPLFAVIDPATEALITQEISTLGFNMADEALSMAFAGRYSKFDVYVSDNLKSTVTLDMATQPTAADTVTLLGQTWTFVAAGTAANPGEVSRGANLGEAQANLLAAINGTGTPGAGTYIEISQKFRDRYVENQVTAAAWAGDACVITGYGKLNASSSLSGAGDDFGAETNKLLFGEYDAVSYAMQMYPTLQIDGLNGEMGREHKLAQLFGAKVFDRHADKLVTFNNIVKAAE